MGKKLLQREIKAIALARLEDAARTTADFKNVIEHWNKRDENRESREQYNEVSRPNEMMLHWDKTNPDDEKGILRSTFGAVIPPPLVHPHWRQLIKGDFIDTIYDSADEMWQLVEDEDIAGQLKSLTTKQKDMVFLRAVRLCTAEQVACYRDKTDRAVRKLYVSALERIREKIAPIIQQQIAANAYNVTFAKRKFIEWYGDEKLVIDNTENE